MSGRKAPTPPPLIGDRPHRPPAPPVLRSALAPGSGKSAYGIRWAIHAYMIEVAKGTKAGNAVEWDDECLRLEGAIYIAAGVEIPEDRREVAARV